MYLKAKPMSSVGVPEFVKQNNAGIHEALDRNRAPKARRPMRRFVKRHMAQDIKPIGENINGTLPYSLNPMLQTVSESS